MRMDVSVLVRAPRSVVWDVVTDIPNAAGTISAIQKIEVLDRPAQGLVGFKWRETRKMFGKDATEVMWITEAVEPSHYVARAESHGAIYTTRVSLSEADGGTRLAFEFNGEPRSFGAKVMAALMGPMMKGSMRKAILGDLEDIKRAAEAR